MKESTFKGAGGLKSFTRSWQPEGKTRGVVVIVFEAQGRRRGRSRS